MSVVIESYKKKFAYNVVLGYNHSFDCRLDIMTWLFANLGQDNYEITYAGPFNDLSARNAIYFFSTNEDALTFKLTWDIPRPHTLMIDPPGGWKYGFPKPIPSDQIPRAEKWLVEQGYPQSEVDQFIGRGLPYRIWEEKDV